MGEGIFPDVECFKLAFNAFGAYLETHRVENTRQNYHE
jgi:hypothetical protein